MYDDEYGTYENDPLNDYLREQKYELDVEDEPIETVDEDGTAHGYTDEDEGMELICNECSHTFVAFPGDEPECPICGSVDLDVE